MTDEKLTQDPPSAIVWLCPHCINPVGETDPKCETCGRGLITMDYEVDFTKLDRVSERTWIAPFVVKPGS